MSAVDVLLLSLCFNATSCPTEDENITSSNLPESNYFKSYEDYDKSIHYDTLRETLRGMKLRVATLQDYPLNWVVKENGEYVGYGIAFTFLHFLQEKYEFNYTIILPPENKIGTNVSGIFGMLASGQADLAVAFLPVLTSANKYLYFSRSLDTGEWVVLMKRPTESAKGSGLLAPFEYDVWLLILLSLAAVGPIIYLIILIRAKVCADDELNKVFPLPSCIWFVYGALLKQGTTLNPATDSSRLLFATWWIFITILTAFYTANLTAFLTLSRFTLPIDKPEDLANPKYSWVAREGLAIKEIVDEPDSELMFLRNSKRGVYTSDDDATIIEKYVQRDSYMYLRDKPGIDHVMYKDYLNKTKNNIPENMRCTYVLTDWAMVKRSRAFAYARNFTWRELFNPVLESLVESGIVKHKLREDLPDTTICPKDLGEKGRQLHNSDLSMTYMVVLGGFVISGAVFLVELIYRKWCQSAQSKSTSKLRDYDNYAAKHFRPPPPAYQTLFHQPYANSTEGKKKIINGRDYWVIKSLEGDTRLIPVRTPSALLFQYTK